MCFKAHHQQLWLYLTSCFKFRLLLDLHSLLLSIHDLVYIETPFIVCDSRTFTPRLAWTFLKLPSEWKNHLGPFFMVGRSFYFIIKWARLCAMISLLLEKRRSCHLFTCNCVHARMLCLGKLYTVPNIIAYGTQPVCLVIHVGLHGYSHSKKMGKTWILFLFFFFLGGGSTSLRAFSLKCL